MRYSATAPVKIIVLGAGGTGGYVIPHLYRLAFARRGHVRIIICDGDIVERKNLVRQNFVEQDIGRNKAQVLAERYSRAFGIECEYRSSFVEDETELRQLDMLICGELKTRYVTFSSKHIGMRAELVKPRKKSKKGKEKKNGKT